VVDVVPPVGGAVDVVAPVGVVVVVAHSPTVVVGPMLEVVVGMHGGSVVDEVGPVGAHGAVVVVPGPTVVDVDVEAGQGGSVGGVVVGPVPIVLVVAGPAIVVVVADEIVVVVVPAGGAPTHPKDCSREVKIPAAPGNTANAPCSDWTS
jgi:hypothetical protein